MRLKQPKNIQELKQDLLHIADPKNDYFFKDRTIALALAVLLNELPIDRTIKHVKERAQSGE